MVQKNTFSVVQVAPDGDKRFVITFKDTVPEEDGFGGLLTYVPALFNPGQVVITAAAYERLEELKLNKLVFLKRHLNADWGELPEEDRLQNDEALKSGNDRFHSSYPLPNGEKLWIITEWDKSATTLLLPDDY